MKHTHLVAAGALALFAVSGPLSAQGKGKEEPGKAKGKQEQHQTEVKRSAPAPVVIQKQQAQKQKQVVQQHAVQQKQQAQAQKQAVQQRAVQQKQAVQQQKQVIKKITRITDQEQRARIAEQQRREVAYRTYLDQRTRALQQQSAQLQQQKRLAQYRRQQQYIVNLQAQQARLRAQRNYNNDPYYYSPYTYSYTRSGAVYQTNQYGADVLKRAVNYGYEEGVRSGQADRSDHYAANYQNNYAYQDANYGYDGLYVSQADYNYYFRQGFQRGYQDGYNSRSQYGNYTPTTASILTSLASSILGLQTIR